MADRSLDPSLWLVDWPGKPWPSGRPKQASLPRWLAYATWPIRKRQLTR